MLFLLVQINLKYFYLNRNLYFLFLFKNIGYLNASMISFSYLVED